MNNNIPDRYKNQLNGNTATQNYIEHKNKIHNQTYNISINKESLEKFIEKALNEIFGKLPLD